MRRHAVRFMITLWLLANLAGAVCADDGWSVERSTNDRNADLIDALVSAQRFEDGLSLCQMLSRGADPAGDVSAKWAIRQSQILVAKQMGQDRFDEAEIQAAAKPVTDRLSSYPEHRRKLFLMAQSSMVQRSAALHRVLRAAISPADDTARDEATQSLLRATVELESLIKEIAKVRVLLDRPAENRPTEDQTPAMIDDLAPVATGAAGRSGLARFDANRAIRVGERRRHRSGNESRTDRR